MANRVTGRVEVLLNGKLLLNKAGAKIGGIGVNGQLPLKKKVVTGDTGIHGYVDEVVVPYCEVKITDRSDVLLSEIAQVNGDGTIIFRSAGGGKIYTMQEATCVNDLSVVAGEGEVDLRFEGPGWIESTEG